MTILGHTSIPAITYISLTEISTIEYSQKNLLILVLASIFPDIVGGIYRIIKGDKFDKTFQHHKWFPHWPITYLPLLIWFFLNPSLEIGLILFGVYSHLFLDLFMEGDGIFLFAPFSWKLIAYFNKQTKGKHGVTWLKTYIKLPLFKIEI